MYDLDRFSKSQSHISLDSSSFRLASIIFIYLLFIIGFIAHAKFQMKSTRVANKVNSVAKGL